MSRKRKEKRRNPRVRHKTNTQETNQNNNFYSLKRRSEDDPMRLQPEIEKELSEYFRLNDIHPVSGQIETLLRISEAVLSAQTGEIKVIPLVPGGGKSTLIRAILVVLSKHFSQMTPIAKRVSGIIVVVEKTSEGRKLTALCNKTANRTVATLIESPNDFNLKRGECFNGTANCYEECLQYDCPDYQECPLMKKKNLKAETPILIMLQARYAYHIEDMSNFLTWQYEDRKFHRTLLLVDELPGIFKETSINLETINKAEIELDKLKPSYNPTVLQEKRNLNRQWFTTIRMPFFKLESILVKKRSKCGLVESEDINESGFNRDSLVQLKNLLTHYTPHSQALQLVDGLLLQSQPYFSIGQRFEIFFPYLCRLDRDGQPATFIFSGTANLSPELSENPKITMLPDNLEESYKRLHIYAQYGDAFSISKTAMSRTVKPSTYWLKKIIAQIAAHHNKIIVVTYKNIAKNIWSSLKDYHDVLIPYIDAEGNQQPMLPYFGGLNGSNLYQGATCMICFGLNRFELKDYLSRTIALDHTGELSNKLLQTVKTDDLLNLSQHPRVMEIQNITLAQDIVQLIFRTALRRHGETKPVEVWLIQPPNDVLKYLQNFFPGCMISEISDFPDECKIIPIKEKNIKKNQLTLQNYLIGCYGGTEAKSLQLKLEYKQD